MKSFMRISFVVVVALLLIPMMAQATPISVGFQGITNNNIEDIGGQLHLYIYDSSDTSSKYGLSIGADQVLFAFTNSVGIPSNVSEIYIDDGTIVKLNLVINNLGGFTRFHAAPPLSPGNLPSGNTVGFVATELLSADTDPGPPKNGIDAAADIVGMVYKVENGISGIQDALADGDLRIGLHVRSIGTGGGSDSYINTPPETPPTPPETVPEAGTLMLLGPGLIGIGLYRWRRKKQ